MTGMVDLDALSFDASGLIPAIVQDEATGTVLMLGWMNRESLEATLHTGLVHFWSRSRNELWQKGETSGNVLHTAAIAVDCDADALLVMASPAGPTCHTEATSCFDGPGEPRPAFGQLGELWSTITRRRTERPEGSYTSALLDGGVDAVARKVSEEATEVLMAAKDHAAGGDVDPLVAESADLLYHLMVLWAERGLGPGAVMEELRLRSS